MDTFVKCKPLALLKAFILLLSTPENSVCDPETKKNQNPPKQMVNFDCL